MLLRDEDLRHCSRAFLEAAEESVANKVAAGRDDLLPRLEAIRSAIPDAPGYTLEHRTVDGWR